MAAGDGAMYPCVILMMMMPVFPPHDHPSPAPPVPHTGSIIIVSWPPPPPPAQYHQGDLANQHEPTPTAASPNIEEIQI